MRINKHTRFTRIEYSYKVRCLKKVFFQDYRFGGFS